MMQRPLNGFNGDCLFPHHCCSYVSQQVGAHANRLSLSRREFQPMQHKAHEECQICLIDHTESTIRSSIPLEKVALRSQVLELRSSSGWRHDGDVSMLINEPLTDLP